MHGVNAAGASHFAPSQYKAPDTLPAAVQALPKTTLPEQLAGLAIHAFDLANTQAASQVALVQLAGLAAQAAAIACTQAPEVAPAPEHAEGSDDG